MGCSRAGRGDAAATSSWCAGTGRGLGISILGLVTNSAQSCAVQIRGAGVGATTATTAILAHGCAGGHWPGSAEWVLLLAVCCSLGVIAVSANIFSRRVGLLMAVSGGQLAGHAVLSLSPLEHHHSMTSVPMMVLHATAVAVCCMVIPLAERAVRGSVSWVLACGNDLGASAVTDVCYPCSGAGRGGIAAVDCLGGRGVAQSTRAASGSRLCELDPDPNIDIEESPNI